MTNRKLILFIRALLIMTGIGMLLPACSMNWTTAEHVDGQLRQHGI